MDRNNNIDRLFKPLRHTSEEAPMHLWPDIEAALPPEPKRKKRFFWLFGFLGLLLLAGGSLAFFAQRSIGLKEQMEKENTMSKAGKALPDDLPAIAKKTNSFKPQLPNQAAPKEHSSRPAIKTGKRKVPSKRISGASVDRAIPEAAHKEFFPQGITKISKDKPPHQRTSHRTPPLETLTRMLPQKKIVWSPKTLGSVLPDEECAGSRVIKVPKSIFVDAYVSPVFSNTFMESRSPELSAYARLRDSTERNGVGWLWGARVGYIHESGLNVRAGLALQQIRNKFKYVVEQDEKMIVQIFRDNNGNIIGRDTTYEFGRRKLSITNKYTTVDLPISVGYISMKNKVQLGLHVGAVVNLNFSQSGTYLDEQASVTEFKNKKIFEKSIGTSFFGSVELQYLLTERWGVFLEPQVRFYPQSLTIKSHPIKQNVTTFNVLSGIKYIF